MKKLLFTCLIIVVCISQSFALDDNREGFSFSVSFGFTPYASWNSGLRNDSFQSANLGLMYGYNIDNSNLISFDLKLPRFSPSMDRAEDFDSTLTYDSYSIVYLGLNWFHFFKLNSRKLYSEFGFGTILTEFAFEEGKRYSTVSDGYAILLGSGVQLSNKFYGGLTYMRGRTTFDNHTINHTVLSCVITYLSY